MFFVTEESFYADPYFNEYDFNFLKKLSEVWDNGEGSTFFNPRIEQQKIQLEFQKKCFSKLNPKNILEVGTHKANYSYFCKSQISDVKIVTFGIDPQSQTCVNLVNEYFSDNFIEFHCGDSTSTLTGYNSEIKFDLAWVDGGHSFQCAYSDLNNCNRLGIENILLDDTIMSGVKDALDAFLKENPKYKVVDASEDERIITWISSSID